MLVKQACNDEGATDSSGTLTRDGGSWLATADVISPRLQLCIVRKEELRCRALWEGQLVLRRPAAGGGVHLALSRSRWNAESLRLMQGLPAKSSHTLKGALAPVKDSDQLLTSCSCLSQQCLTLYQGSPSTKIRQAWGRQHLALLAGGLLAGTSSAGHCSLLLAL